MSGSRGTPGDGALGNSALTALESVLAKHRRFWRRESDSFLLRRVPERVFRTRSYPLSGGRETVDPLRITATDLDLGRLVGITRGEQNPSVMMGELLGHAGPVFPEAWMEAIIGCPIYASGYGCTAKPAAAVPFAELVVLAREAAGGFSSSPWYARLDETIAQARAVAEPVGFPVRQPHLRGVVDMVAAFIGEEQLCLSAFDDPEGLAVDCWAETVAS